MGRVWIRTILAMVAGAALFASTASWRDATAQGRIYGKPAPTIRKSGAERSADLLKEISATLNRIDGRLERLENAAFQQDSKKK